METIRTRTHAENGHITVDVPAHWNNQDVEVVLVADLSDDSPVAPSNGARTDAKIGNGAHIMAIAQAIVDTGGVKWPMDVMEWQRAERQDRPLPGRE